MISEHSLLKQVILRRFPRQQPEREPHHLRGDRDPLRPVQVRNLIDQILKLLL
jgi:hypothetical protein